LRRLATGCQLVTFTLIVRHAAGSNATAHNIGFSDVIRRDSPVAAKSLTNTDGAPATLTEAAASPPLGQA
jgi:hypothetical protein